jgi:predicted transcriptional regulator
MKFEFDTAKKTRIREVLKKNPGLYLSKIAELLNMNISEVEWYISKMILDGEITSTQKDGYTIYKIQVIDFKKLDRRSTETREKLYNLISTYPGLHLSKIAKLLDIRPSLAEYHLIQLEKASLITTSREKGYYKRYYIKESDASNQERKLLALLRQKIPLRIALLLIKHPLLRHKDIAEKLSVHPATLSYHLNKLVEQNIVKVAYHGSEKGYSLENKDEVKEILKKYNINIELYVAAEDFKDIWEDFNYNND